MSTKKTRQGARPLARSSTMGSGAQNTSPPMSSSLYSPTKDGKNKRNSKTATFLTDLDGKGNKKGGRKDNGKSGNGRRSKSPTTGKTGKGKKSSQLQGDEDAELNASHDDGDEEGKESRELSSHPLTKRDPLTIEEKIAYRREQLRVQESEGEWKWRQTEKLGGRASLSQQELSQVELTLPKGLYFKQVPGGMSLPRDLAEAGKSVSNLAVTDPKGYAQMIDR